MPYADPAAAKANARKFYLPGGGAHGYVNVQPAHPACNLRKGAK